MTQAPADTLTSDMLDKWLQIGPKKLTIDDETDFVDPPILKGVLEAKVYSSYKFIYLKSHFHS